MKHFSLQCDEIHFLKHGEGIVLVHGFTGEDGWVVVGIITRTGVGNQIENGLEGEHNKVHREVLVRAPFLDVGSHLGFDIFQCFSSFNDPNIVEGNKADGGDAPHDISRCYC